MIRRIKLVCAALALLLPMVARAEHTRFWRQSDYDDFQRGTAAGVAVRSDGKITPAPRFDSFADPSMSVLWSLRLDSQGRLYAAGGSDAKVLRFDAAGKSTTVFESPELEAQAIAFDGKGNLFVGTSPDGKVYKVTPDGTKSVFFDPKAKYIWSLAIDQQGNLFVGTGDTGQIFVVTPDGKGKSFYQSDQRHARALAFDAKGNLLVGTEPDGLILRIPIARKGSAAPEAGAPFVLYETSKKEVTSLLEDGSGNIYASAIGEKTRTPNAPMPQPSMPAPQPTASSPAPAAAPSAQVSATITVQPQAASAAPSIPASYLGASANGAEVVKIAPDDSPQTLWSSREDIVLSLGLSPDNKLLLGTGNRGTIVRLEGNGVYSNIEHTAAMQVTSLVAAPDGKIYAATANPGKIFTVGPGFQPDGNFVSSTYDASIFSRWGRIAWWGEDGGAQGRVEFYVRSGNTSNPEKNWSDWAGPYKSASGETVNCPAARFVQWKAVFLKGDDKGQPSISWVSLAFQPKNVAPVIDAIAVQDPGVRVGGYQQGGAIGAPPAQLRIPESAGSDVSILGGEAEASARQARAEIPQQAVQQHGFQSVLWSAHDNNDDTLTYSIYYRGEGETNWRLLKDKISDQYYSWDTSTMPDGAYYLKIVASDAPSNPANEALTAERESDRFIVGNTPPQIDGLHAQTNAGATTLSFGATTTSGTIARATYSVDSTEWQVVFPVGQLTDAPKENYKWDISNLAPGEHTVSVRVTDRFGNETAAKTTFTVAAPSGSGATSASAVR